MAMVYQLPLTKPMKDKGATMKYTLIILCLFALAGCDKGVDSPRGFSLPEGNAEKGKAVFIKYECLACHTLTGVEDDSIKKHDDISIRLGGNKTKIVTYAELVTSVINPSHRFSRPYRADARTSDGASKMTVFNDTMTVSELTDLVTFLQPNYKLIPYHRTKYSDYK